ncbi:hypothetical protein [Microvirga arabica]|uniref:hypothetical protein n=1 Tax=Microvirga arabica TaxID=1128671 RepID=UPI00193A0BC6|nr:hypothetical protein [Microvirga arabica]MBM1169653.1 hypothetical protein [Microvirga arabica]
MAEGVTSEVAVGDKVRVHFHPPGSLTSFLEGVVRRVDVTTPEGRFFVVEVTHEVILDQEHRVRPGFQDYVRYECPNDFPGRIEVLSATEENVEEPALKPETGTVTEILREPQPEQSGEPVSASQQLIEFQPVAEPLSAPEPLKVKDEHRDGRRRGGLIATLFGR